MLPTIWSAPVVAAPTRWVIDPAEFTSVSFNAAVNFNDANTFFNGIDPQYLNN